MAEIVPHKLSGVIIADERWGRDTYDTVNSTASQAGPEPDQPTFATPNSESMQLEATGVADLTVTSGPLTVTALRQGLPRPGSTATRFSWYGQGSTTPRGWLPYSVVTGFQLVQYNDALALHGAFLPRPHAAMVVYKDVSDGYVYVVRLDRHGKIGANALTWNDPVLVGNMGSSPQPRLVVLPSGRLLIVARQNTSYPGGASYTTVQIAISDNDGDTWARAADVSDGLRVDTGSYTVEDFTVCYHGSYLTLVAQVFGANRELWHWISTDLGASWTLIEQYTAVSTYGHRAVGLDDGSVLLYYVKGSDKSLYLARKRAPAALFSTDPSFNTSADNRQGSALNAEYSTNGDRACIAPCIDQDGTIQIAGLLNNYSSTGNDDGRVRLLRHPQSIVTSADSIEIPFGGDTYSAEPIDLGDTSGTVMQPRALIPFKGSLLLIGNTISTFGTADQSICVTWLGGYSSVDFNGPTFGRYNDATIYGRAYLAVELPSSIAIWMNSGAGTQTLTSDGLRFNLAAGQRSYSRALVASVSTSIITWVRHRQSSGGSTAADASIVHVRAADGVADYAVKLRFSTTGCAIFDVNAAADDATVSGLTPDVHYDWLIHQYGAFYEVYYKLATADVWTVAHTGSLTNNGATPLAAGLIEWGHPNSVTQDDYWLMVNCSDALGYSFGTIGQSLSMGREMAARWLYLEDGVRVRAADGPAYRGDVWTIPIRYQYGADALDCVAVRSPATMWRSITNLSTQIHQWDLGASDAPPGSAIGIVLLNPNFRTGYLERSSDNSSWTEVLTIDTTAAFGAPTFDRSGFLLKPASGTQAGGIFYAANELAAVGNVNWTAQAGTTTALQSVLRPRGYALMTSGLTSYVAPIAEHNAGVWRDTGNVALHLRLAGTTTEIAALPSSGTLRIIHPLVAAIAYNQTTPARYWRLRIPAQATYEGYERAKVLIGPLVAFAWQASPGRGNTLEPVQEITDYRDGKSTVRQRNALRRTVTIPWEEVASYGIYASSPNPDYLVAASGQAGLAVQVDHTFAEGILRRAVGAKRPVVYLANLAAGASAGTSQTVMGAERVLYGSIDGSVSRSATLGDEAYYEASGTALTVREEL